jgi:quinol monooxygenase YgiN
MPLKLRQGFGHPLAQLRSADVVMAEKAFMSVADGNMIIAIVAIKAPSGRCDELCRALMSLSGPFQAQPGCASWQLFQEISDPGALRIESRWNTSSDLFWHIRSEAYRRFLQMMELGAKAPTIEFFSVSELRGLDLIRAAREPSD